MRWNKTRSVLGWKTTNTSPRSWFDHSESSIQERKPSTAKRPYWGLLSTHFTEVASMSCTAICRSLNIMAMLKELSHRLVGWFVCSRHVITRLGNRIRQESSWKSAEHMFEQKTPQISIWSGPWQWWRCAFDHQRQAAGRRHLASAIRTVPVGCQSVALSDPKSMEDLLVVRPQVLRSVKKQRAEAHLRCLG